MTGCAFTHLLSGIDPSGRSQLPWPEDTLVAPRGAHVTRAFLQPQPLRGPEPKPLC